MADWKDNGWKSRKLWFGAFAIVMLFWAGDRAGLALSYTQFAESVVAITGIVLIGNVATKYVASRTTTGQTPTTPSPKAPGASQAKILIPESSPDAEESPR